MPCLAHLDVSCCTYQCHDCLACTNLTYQCIQCRKPHFITPFLCSKRHMHACSQMILDFSVKKFRPFPYLWQAPRLIVHLQCCNRGAHAPTKLSSCGSLRTGLFCSCTPVLRPAHPPSSALAWRDNHGERGRGCTEGCSSPAVRSEFIVLNCTSVVLLGTNNVVNAHDPCLLRTCANWLCYLYETQRETLWHMQTHRWWGAHAV